jgi:hypothetical protein
VADQPDHEPTHDHGWEPIQGWYGRYRCRLCGALGHRGTIFIQGAGDLDNAPLYGSTARVAAIVPYRCQIQGCTRSAVVIKPRQRCALHAHPKGS